VAHIIRNGGLTITFGYVLINTASAKEHEVYKILCDIPEMIEVTPLFGEYDLIVKVEAKDVDTIGNLVVDKIRTIPGVRDTKTLTSIEFG